MIYHLFQLLKDYDFPGHGLMTYLTFRAILASMISLLVALSAGKKIIRSLQKHQIGETIRDLGLQGQMEKKGTPTMGGIIIIVAVLSSVLLVGDLTNIYNLLLILTTVWCGALGFADDYIKVFKKNKNGLSERKKLIGQISRIGVRNIGHHRFPNLAFDFEGWLVKTYLIEKSPFKGLIQIFSQVCGSDEDSVQILHFLKDDVLDGVLHLVNRSFRPLLTNTEDSVGFIEEKNGNGAAFSHACAILIEYILDVLLAFPNPAALDLRHVHDEKVAPAFASNLVDSFCFPSTRATVK